MVSSARSKYKKGEEKKREQQEEKAKCKKRNIKRSHNAVISYHIIRIIILILHHAPST
jgi:hypothetical protein